MARESSDSISAPPSPARSHGPRASSYALAVVYSLPLMMVPGLLVYMLAVEDPLIALIVAALALVAIEVPYVVVSARRLSALDRYCEFVAAASCQSIAEVRSAVMGRYGIALEVLGYGAIGRFVLIVGAAMCAFGGCLSLGKNSESAVVLFAVASLMAGAFALVVWVASDTRRQVRLIRKAARYPDRRDVLLAEAAALGAHT